MEFRVVYYCTIELICILQVIVESNESTVNKLFSLAIKQFNECPI